jgi:phospholipid N-methyltransferase
MKNKANFFKEFLRERKTVGAITPSSKYLAKKMLSPIDFNKALNIVELGPGTGIITKEIIKKMRSDARLLVFETQKNFCDLLNHEINDKRVTIINDTAEKMEEYLRKYGIEKADYTVSSLPFMIIPDTAKNTILNTAVKFLKDDGLFIQYQYSLNALKLLKSKFKNVKLDFTPINIPPAFIYKCSLN